MANQGLAKKVNILCLLVAIATILVLPLKKEIWYDESISIFCSKGINSDSPALFAHDTTLNSATIEGLNTLPNVYKATILDNGNSLLYNVSLHYFTLLCGNSISAYMLLSKLSSIAALLAFFALCGLFFKDSIFTGLAIILLATDLNFIGMSHEIRAYSMGTFLIVLAAIYFYKFMYGKEKPQYLLLTGLFCVGAVLCHFLSVYVVLVLVGYLIVKKKAKLFSAKNLGAMLLPLAIAGVYFYFAVTGLRYMSAQNETIAHKALAVPFNIMHVALRSMAMGAVDFKIVFSAFREQRVMIILSFLIVVGMYFGAIKSTKEKTERRNMNLLLLLGISGTLFLAMLCVKSHHYTALYNRYHSFCAPFACLFMAYALYVIFKNDRVNMAVKGCAFAVIVLPSCGLFLLSLRNNSAMVKYNHIALAEEIAHDRVSKVEVPGWEDALLIQSVLPSGYKIDYVLNKQADYFTLYKPNGIEKVTIVRSNL